MTPAVTKPPTVLPGDLVRTALDEPKVRDGLLHHALSILARRLGDRPAVVRLEAATDAVQETHLRSLQKCNDYDPTKSVRAWLHGIMNNVVFETVRTIRCLPVQESANFDTWERLATAFSQQAKDSVSTRPDVAEYLAKLPNEHVEIIKLRYSDGMKHEEIATSLGISVGNARVRLCRAINAARAIAGAVPQEARP